MMRLVACCLVSCVFLSSCSHPQIATTSRLNWSRSQKVAVLPFEDLTGAGSGKRVGELAARFFAHGLLNISQYQVIDQRIVQVKLGGRTEMLDPIELGKELGVDGVVIGSVSVFKRSRLLIFPPASAAIEVKMLNVETGQIQWSATYHRGYEWWRWLLLANPPIGIFLAVVAPSDEGRLKQACKGTTKALEFHL